MDKIYLHIFSTFAEKKNKAEPENEDKKGETVINKLKQKYENCTSHCAIL